MPNELTSEPKLNRASRPATPRQALLSFKQLEEVFGPPARSWYDLHTSGSIKAVRFGRRLWVPRTEAERYLTNSLVANA